MVVPLGGMGGGGMGGLMPEDAGGPPQVVKDYHSKYWWFLLFLLVCVCAAEFAAMDIFDAVFTGLLGVCVWYMVKKDCSQMSQYCLMMFGIMCAIQSVFELISLVSSLGGRKTSHTVTKSLSDSSTSYTTVVETHPFFDQTQGLQYNIQSAVKIVSPATMVIACILCWFTYRAYPTSLFSTGDEENEALPGSRLGGGYGGGYGGGGGGPQYGSQQTEDRPTAGSVFGRSAQPAPRVFEGAGHRLGGPA